LGLRFFYGWTFLKLEARLVSYGHFHPKAHAIAGSFKSILPYIYSIYPPFFCIQSIRAKHPLSNIQYEKHGMKNSNGKGIYLSS
jgi:hypothetical protein